ncbi:MAG: chloride channel protein [Polyangiaceae bacterium]
MSAPSLVDAIVLRFRRLIRWRNPKRLPSYLVERAPIDLGIVGRTLLHAAAVGVVAGLVGAAFFAGLEYVQRGLLEELVGYVPLRADGETFAAGETHGVFHWWLLPVLPALGGLACGLITRLAPEARGGGGDAMIEAFHEHGGHIRKRVIWTKFLASLFTLGTGGAGGREGPIMQIGGALGGLVARALRVSQRERRILMVAGVAAGMSAVFRTPLGAALLAVEVLYKDGFESDSLIPAVLASVVSYSVIISVFGESTLFARVPSFPFQPRYLPLFGLLAVLTAALSAGFVWVYGRVGAFFSGLAVPDWARPALGGLLLGALCTPLIYWVGNHVGAPGQGLGMLGGGYGAVQMAIAGSPFLTEGWTAVGLLLALTLAKLLASSITIGSGGSAGDFAPSLAMGGLFGGAFGRMAQLLFHDPRIQPGAFALVGMGTFYGGIAHVPLSALVMVCELAGNYDLLVPLMLAQGIAFVALRHRSLYHAQVTALRDSTTNRDATLLDILRTVRVRDVMKHGPAPICFFRETSTPEIIRQASNPNGQEVFPVLGVDGKLVGLISPASLRVLAAEQSETAWTLAADLMQAVVSVRLEDDLRTATTAMLDNDLRELPVVSQDERLIGLLDETDISEVYLHAAARAESADRAAPIMTPPPNNH